MKETVAQTLEWLQTQPRCNMREWALENPTEFYRIASKLIPTELVGKDGNDLIPIGKVVIVHTDANKPAT